MTYCLYDWAGNMLTDRKGHALEFDSFDDGWAYISDNYCEADQEDLYILEKYH